jgi:DNA-binding NarL/FixJ family response regulator
MVAAYDAKKLVVLIVDDSVSIRERLYAQVKDLPNIGTVITASRFDEAVKHFQEHEPGLVLLDIGLNEMRTGIDLLRIIKQKNPATKIMMLSNRANKFYRELCFSLGCTHFVDKSKEFEKIPALILDITSSM